jgi:lipopolysaccharide export LptBFGC system permease protein LptF
MAPKMNNEKRSLLAWCMHFLLILISGSLALVSAYMAYKITRESSISVGFAGIGFYVMYYLGGTFIPDRAK